MRVLSKDTSKKIGKEISVSGWVHSRRDHGGLIFIDLRDHTGIVQLTIHPEASDAFAIGEGLRDEYVITATGKVVEREEGLKNPNIVSGDVEIVVQNITILNKSEPLPVQINNEEQLAGEEIRLKYRYLDLRREKMQLRLKQRSDYYKIMRTFMDEREFIEVSTPILASSSPEGARDLLVPSRLQPGKFYALPQAPQQFKQLLMVGGVPRYYQIAPVFRDEDPRADRLYGEFYQLDMEMSFVDDGETVRKLMEPLIIDLATTFANKQLVFDKVPRISFNDAMNTYGSDKPDLRFDMKIINLTQELTDCGFGVFAKNISSGGEVKAIVAAKKFSRKEIDQLTDLAKTEGAGGLPYLFVEDGKATGSIAKFFSDEHLANIVETTGAKEGETILFGSDTNDKVNKVLGRLRSQLGDDLNLKDANKIALVWIVDFPFYEMDEKTNKLDFGHNPFTMPKNGAKELDREDKTAIVADQFDMVMNGYEICSGGVRNHSPEIMYKAFGVLGYNERYVEERFGAMLNAFKFGAPPHAGCAFGVDRMFMELVGEDNIREVVAFPKNGSGVDVMMQSPSPVDTAQLDELGIEIIEQE